MSLESKDGEEKVKVGFSWQLSDGRYLSGRDSDFIELVTEDLQSFNKKDIRDSIFIFPPFKNFHRFLIHNLVEENFKDLTTFSVGHSRRRRTVVCFKDRVIQNRSEDQDRSTCGSDFIPMGIEQRTSECHEVNITSAYSGRKKARTLPDVALYQPPALRRASEGTSGGTPLDRNPKPSKQRRPDIAVYVPRALRGSACTQRGPLVANVKDSRAERISPCPGMTVESDGGGQSTVAAVPHPSPDKRSAASCCLHSGPHTTTSPLGPHLSSSPPTSRAAALAPSVFASLPESSPGDIDEEEEKSPLQSTSADVAQNVKRIPPGGRDHSPQAAPTVCGVQGDIEGTCKGEEVSGTAVSSIGMSSLEIFGVDAKSGEGLGERGVEGVGGMGHWEDLFDECGEGEGKFGGEMVDEVVAAVGKVSVVEKPRLDYAQYRTDDAVLSLAELAHVVEVFGFPAEFKTHDLISILSPYGGGPGFEIKWVDDTHALAVFGSSFVAADVLNLRHPMLKTRAMEEASAVSKAKARRICETLRVPYRPRPETCAALAQRLITGALGVQHRQSKAEREEERRLLREAREKRRNAARERDAAWEGTIGSTLL